MLVNFYSPLLEVPVLLVNVDLTHSVVKISLYIQHSRHIVLLNYVEIMTLIWIRP